MVAKNKRMWQRILAREMQSPYIILDAGALPAFFEVLTCA